MRLHRVAGKGVHVGNASEAVNPVACAGVAHGKYIPIPVLAAFVEAGRKALHAVILF
jgi:hypothetical protein